MFYWNLSSEAVQEWEPKSGWNSVFSEEDKIKYTNLFFFFKNKKRIKENIAEILAEMILFKEKYSGLTYSDSQEEQLRAALQPVYNS
jgi:hypothetical protein